MRRHYNCQVSLIFTLITSWVIHLSWNLPIGAHESNTKCPLKQYGTVSHRYIYYVSYQSQRQALCLTEFSSQLKCWNCTASSKGEVILDIYRWTVYLPRTRGLGGVHNLGGGLLCFPPPSNDGESPSPLIPFHSIKYGGGVHNQSLSKLTTFDLRLFILL